MTDSKKLFLNFQTFKGSEEEFLAIEEFRKKEWQLNYVPHRDNGPAIIYKHPIESSMWFVNGLRHRIGGPAVTAKKINKEDSTVTIIRKWYVNGIKIEFDSWLPVDLYEDLEDEL